MPDNVTLPGTGAAIATDEVDDGAGLRQFQLVKLAHGADGAASLVSEANGLPVQAVGELMEAIEALRSGAVLVRVRVHEFCPGRCAVAGSRSHLACARAVFRCSVSLCVRPTRAEPYSGPRNNT